MYFSFGEDSGTYLIVLLCGLFALWWLLRKTLKLFGDVFGLWLFSSVVAIAVGVAVSPMLSILGIISLIIYFAFLCGLDGRINKQYYIDRTNRQKEEEENYGIVDYTNKDE